VPSPKRHRPGLPIGVGPDPKPSHGFCNAWIARQSVAAGLIGKPIDEDHPLRIGPGDDQIRLDGALLPEPDVVRHHRVTQLVDMWHRVSFLRLASEDVVRPACRAFPRQHRTNPIERRNKTMNAGRWCRVRARLRTSGRHALDCDRSLDHAPDRRRAVRAARRMADLKPLHDSHRSTQIDKATIDPILSITVKAA